MKQKRVVRTNAIMVRASREEKATLAEAARVAGLDLSGWLRSVGLREAATTLRKDKNP